MANIKSAKKRIDVIKRRREENKFVKTTISTKIKNFRKTLAAKDFATAEEQLTEITALVNSACSKGILHKNNSSRKVSRLSMALSNAKKQENVVEAAPKKVEKVVEEKAEVKEVKETKAPAKKATKKAAEKEEKPAKKAIAKKATAKKATKEVAEEEKPAKKTATKKASSEKKTTTKKATKKAE